jgi:hypothetical protein
MHQKFLPVAVIQVVMKMFCIGRFVVTCQVSLAAPFIKRTQYGLDTRSEIIVILLIIRKSYIVSSAFKTPTEIISRCQSILN